LGLAFKKEGEIDRALQQFERLVQLAPDEPVSRYQLGALYKQANRMDDAKQEFNTAARLNPISRRRIFSLQHLPHGRQS